MISRRQLLLSLPIALAFADASIVLLALPEIVARLHTSISHVVWVIIVYNLALIVGSLAVRLLPARLDVEPMLVGGLLLFGAASLICGLASNLTLLLVFRAAQGIGGAVLLCASLPPLARDPRSGRTSLQTWSAAAAIGAAVGPAAGGILTQVFDWRAIFIAQAPVAVGAAIAIWRLNHAQAISDDFTEPSAFESGDASVNDPVQATSPIVAARANLALGLLSAGLIGALFLSTLLLINVWGYTPITAAVVLLALPLMTAVTGRFGRRIHPLIAGASGAVALIVGLLVLSTVTHRQLLVCVLSLLLSGAGLGVAFSALTHEALRSSHGLLDRVANTIASRDAGLVVGLLVLTPIFVHQLNDVQTRALPPITRTVLAAGMPTHVDLQLAAGLLKAVSDAPQSQLPDIGPPFARVEAANPSSAATLRGLEPKVQTEIRSAATKAFASPIRGAGGFALAVLLVLAVPLGRRRQAAAVA